jgi:hypothetical protein
MAITKHHDKANRDYHYYKVGSYKVAECDLMRILEKAIGEDEVKKILARFEKDEGGYTVAELKPTK